MLFSSERIHSLEFFAPLLRHYISHRLLCLCQVKTTWLYFNIFCFFTHLSLSRASNYASKSKKALQATNNIPRLYSQFTFKLRHSLDSNNNNYSPLIIIMTLLLMIFFFSRSSQVQIASRPKCSGEKKSRRFCTQSEDSHTKKKKRSEAIRRKRVIISIWKWNWTAVCEGAMRERKPNI